MNFKSQVPFEVLEVYWEHDERNAYINTTHAHQEREREKEGRRGRED